MINNVIECLCILNCALTTEYMRLRQELDCEKQANNFWRINIQGINVLEYINNKIF